MSRLKVLVVDDHFLFAQALGSVIKELPRYELVGPAVTGPQALAMASERQPELVLLDYHLPGYSADTLIPRFRTLVPSARVIVLTSDMSDSALSNAVRAGAVGFMTKDKAVEDVVDALDAVAAGATLLTADQLARANVERPLAAAAPPRADPAAARPAAPDPAPGWAPQTATARAIELPEWPAFPAPARASAAPPVTAPAAPPAAAGLVLLRIDGVDSFARLAQLEQAIERLPIVARVYVRDSSGRSAALRIGLRAGATVDDLASALGTGVLGLSVSRREPGVLDARLAPAAGG